MSLTDTTTPKCPQCGPGPGKHWASDCPKRLEGLLAAARQVRDSEVPISVGTRHEVLLGLAHFVMKLQADASLAEAEKRRLVEGLTEIQSLASSTRRPRPSAARRTRRSASPSRTPSRSSCRR